MLLLLNVFPFFPNIALFQKKTKQEGELKPSFSKPSLEFLCFLLCPQKFFKTQKGIRLGTIVVEGPEQALEWKLLHNILVPIYSFVFLALILDWTQLVNFYFLFIFDPYYFFSPRNLKLYHLQGIPFTYVIYELLLYTR